MKEVILGDIIGSRFEFSCMISAITKTKKIKKGIQKGG